MIETLDKMKIKALDLTVQRLIMSDEEYFGNGLKGYTSNSLLGLINPEQGGSFEKFTKGFTEGNKYVSAFQLGSAVHALILEKDNYRLSDMEKPGGKVGFIADDIHTLTTKKCDPLGFEEALKQACATHDYYTTTLTKKRLDTVVEKTRDYLEYLTTDIPTGTIILTKEQRNKCIGAVASIKGNRDAMSLLYPSFENNPFAEIYSFKEDVITIEVEVEVTVGGDEVMTIVLPLKAKLDDWSIDLDEKIITLNDLKTTGKPVKYFPGARDNSYYQDANGNTQIEKVFYPGSFQNYHYPRQMGMYGWMLWKYCQHEYKMDSTWKMRSNMIVVETNDPYNSQVFKVDKCWIDYGYSEFTKLVKMVAYYKLFGESTSELMFEIK